MAITTRDLEDLITRNRRYDRRPDPEFESKQERSSRLFNEGFATKRPRDAGYGGKSNIDLNRNIILRKLADAESKAGIASTRASTAQTQAKTAQLGPEFDLAKMIAESEAKRRGDVSALERAKFEQTQELVPLQSMLEVIKALPTNELGEVGPQFQPIINALGERFGSTLEAILAPKEDGKKGTGVGKVGIGTKIDPKTGKPVPIYGNVGEKRELKSGGTSKETTEKNVANDEDITPNITSLDLADNQAPGGVLGRLFGDETSRNLLFNEDNPIQNLMNYVTRHGKGQVGFSGMEDKVSAANLVKASELAGPFVSPLVRLMAELGVFGKYR